jgi:hypothetical protein
MVSDYERERSGANVPPRFAAFMPEREQESNMRNSKKQIDLRIEKAYRAGCSGVQINIMDIPKVFNFGRIKVAEGEDDASLAASIAAYVSHLVRL